MLMLIDLNISWHLSIVSLLYLILGVELVVLQDLFTVELSQLWFWLMLIGVCFAVWNILV